MKLLSIQGQNALVISNGNGLHGGQQGNMAEDFGWSHPSKYKLFAPTKCAITRVWGTGKDTPIGYDKGFDYEYSGNRGQVIHCEPVRVGNFEAGEWFATMGMGAAPHCHTAVEIRKGSGNWKSFVSLCDKNIILYSTSWGLKQNKWADRNTYPDLDALTGLPINNNEMINTFPTKCLVIYDDTLIRQDPNRSKDPIGTLAANTQVVVSAYATGEDVNGSNVWCYIGNGYVHMSLLKVDTSLEEQVKSLEAQVLILTQKSSQYVARIDELEKVVLGLTSELKTANTTIKNQEDEISTLKTDLETCENSKDNGIIAKIADFIKKIIEWIKPKEK